MRATSTGSPASRRPKKLTPFTTRPALTSRHGMIRFASMEKDSLAETSAALKRDKPWVARASASDRVFWRSYSMEQLLQYLWLVPVGFVIGAYGTLIGAGGGFVLVPLLLLFYPK